MILASLFGIKAAGTIPLKKMVGVSLVTSGLSDLFWGTVSYHYWDGQKNKVVRVKKRRRR